MRETHQKNTVRYFLIVVALLFFLFLSGDFGLVDVQKTAIVMAVGIDREEDTFIVTSQIAVPKASDQGKSNETVQIVSRGKTVADAFEEINAKTGWYPKLVFCRLVLLGENTAKENAFDALDFFLLDEYLSDNCLIATCDGYAKDVLNTQALVDAAGSLAIQKVLSSHAQRVGTVLPSTLREFAIGYYSEGKSGFLPILKTQPQQEEIGESSGEKGSAGGSETSKDAGMGGKSGANGNTQSDSGSGQSGEDGGSSSGDSPGGGNGNQKQSSEQQKPVFSASETALFYAGKRVGKLTEEETFAFNMVKNKIRLAAYTVETDEGAYSLTVKRNTPKTSCTFNKNGKVAYKIDLVVNAGLLDASNAFDEQEGIDAGDVPQRVFAAAEKRLRAQITATFEKARTDETDIFGILEYLEKFEPKHFEKVKDVALKNATLEVSVRFQNIR